MTSVVDLGQMRIDSTRIALSVAVSSSARISTPTADQNVLEFIMASHPVPDRFWISRGKRLRLTLDIDFCESMIVSYSVLDIQDGLTSALLEKPVSCPSLNI